MEAEPLTPAVVCQTLRLMAQIEISEEEAAAVIPWIELNRRSLALLDRFDVREVRPASVYDPAARRASDLPAGEA